MKIKEIVLCSAAAVFILSSAVFAGLPLPPPPPNVNIQIGAPPAPRVVERETIVIKEKKDAATFGAPITKPLAPGRYLVSWATVSDDGHAVKGFIPFSVIARQ